MKVPEDGRWGWGNATATGSDEKHRGLTVMPMRTPGTHGQQSVPRSEKLLFSSILLPLIFLLCQRLKEIGLSE